MAVSAVSARGAVPFKSDITVVTASATGQINLGDWLCTSGQYVMATYTGHTAYWKTSGYGIALESNPMYDQAGRIVTASALKILTQGVLHVSASFSGVPALGYGAYPDATGSGVAVPTGATGVGATWNTGEIYLNSGLAGTAAAQVPNVAVVIGSTNHSNAGTGELILRLMPLAPDIRG